MPTSRLFTLVLPPALLACSGLAAGEPAAPPADAFKSVFISDPAYGKDPFFPKSTRRPLPVAQPVAAAPVVTQEPELSESLHLKGISLAAGRKLALVNYYTFAEGEEADLRIQGRTVRVTCVQIKDRSVVVNVKGKKKELQLRPGL